MWAHFSLRLRDGMAENGRKMSILQEEYDKE